MKALSKFSKSASEEYLEKYQSVRLKFINGESVTLSRRDAKNQLNRIDELVKNKLITSVYKLYSNGDEERIPI